VVFGDIWPTQHTLVTRHLKEKLVTVGKSLVVLQQITGMSRTRTFHANITKYHLEKEEQLHRSNRNKFFLQMPGYQSMLSWPASLV
jgi:hypothetical protein